MAPENKTQNTNGKPCQNHEVRIGHLEINTEKQWAAIEKLQNRLPVWATLVISLLTFLLGAAITYASLAARLAIK